MVKKIIGSKTTIGFEIQNANLDKLPMMAKIRIWIGNTPIGQLNDDVYVFDLLQKMRSIKLIDTETIEFRLSFSEIDNWYKVLDSKKTNTRFDSTVLGLGEAFDDFIIYAYIYGEFVEFCWRLIESPFYKYPFYKNKTNKIFCFRLKKEIYFKNLEDFEKFVKKARG